MKGEEMQTRSVAIRHVVPAVLIWLATPACESSSGLESPELTSGTLTLIIATSGGPGAAHYDVVVDDSIHISASPNDSITVDLGPQHHGFEIRGLGQCTISPSSRKSAGFSFTNEQKVRWFATYVRCPFAPLHGRIVFDGQPANGGFALYSIRSDGTDQWLLLEEESFPLQLGVSEWFVRPQVSPDGRRIASAVLSNLSIFPAPVTRFDNPESGLYQATVTLSSVYLSSLGADMTGHPMATRSWRPVRAMAWTYSLKTPMVANGDVSRLTPATNRCPPGLLMVSASPLSSMSAISR
jgi:hypothetical protein